MKDQGISTEDLKLIVEEEKTIEFGPMSSRKAVPALSGFTPSWRVRMVLKDFLVKQADTKKRLEGIARPRQRDVDRDKIRRIVDGRASAGTA